MYKSIAFQIGIVLEIRISLVNVKKSAEIRVAKIYDVIHTYMALKKRKKCRGFPFFYDCIFIRDFNLKSESQCILKSYVRHFRLTFLALSPVSNKVLNKTSIN